MKLFTIILVTIFAVATIQGQVSKSAKDNPHTIGLDAGWTMVAGDISSNVGIVLGLSVRVALGELWGLEVYGQRGVAFGQNLQGAQGWSLANGNYAELGEFAPNEALAGGGRYEQFAENGIVPDYRGLNANIVYYNYQMTSYACGANARLSLHNWFWKGERDFRWYVYGGLGFLFYNTKMDQLDANGNEYDYSVLTLSSVSDPKTIANTLNDLRDGVYESNAERHFADNGFGNMNLIIAPQFGTQVGFQTDTRLELLLGISTFRTKDDLLDGQRWTEWSGLTRDYDRIWQIKISLNYVL